MTDRYLDLRVDDHEEPVEELLRLFNLHQLYFKKSKGEEILFVEGGIKEDLACSLYKSSLLTAKDPTDDQLLDALQDFHLIENFNESMQVRGQGIRVLQFKG